MYVGRGKSFTPENDVAPKVRGEQCSIDDDGASQARLGINHYAAQQLLNDGHYYPFKHYAPPTNLQVLI